MKTTAWFLMITAMLSWGCREHFITPDITPPAPPAAVQTWTGDNMIQISWVHNTEADLAGYHVYVSTNASGPYHLIGTTLDNVFIDVGARNGTTYYYGVTAFDWSGNESEFNNQLVYDTPRPEGRHVSLGDYRTAPSTAGYDFSTISVGPYDDQYTDFFFESYQGRVYLDVWTDSDIQDMGYTSSLSEIGTAPASG
jgi:hypothetical protein